MPAVLNRPRLVLRFTKLSHDYHKLSFTRADGSGETLELETRSFLTHDFLHIAVESEAKLACGVFGTLVAGSSCVALAANDMTAPATDETRALYAVERIVGPLTSLVQGKSDPSLFLENLRAQYVLSCETPPPWLTDGFVFGVQERYRRLMGQWKATAFGATMDVMLEIWPGCFPRFAPRAEML
jgi:hypothetical protein